MRLIAVTMPCFFPREEEIITALFEAGLERLHLRKPGCGEAELRALLDGIPAVHHPRIVLHEHFRLTDAYRLGGIHLNRRNPSVPSGYHKGSISRSCHSIAELKEHSGPDYLFLSPLFASISKAGYGNGFPPESLREASDAGIIGKRVFAMGGISAGTIRRLLPYSFGGVAVLGALWGGHPCAAEKDAIIERYKQLADMASEMRIRWDFPSDISRLMFITHRTNLFTEADEVRRVVEGGCDWVQLRVKEELTPELAQAVSRYVNGREGCRCCLNDYVELALRTGFHGVHLGKDDMPPGEARRRIKEAGKEGRFLLGATANTFEDIARAARAGADYIGLGPYRFTTTKEKLSPMLGIDGYRTIIGQCRENGIRIPIFAVGGIRFEDIAPLMEAGADGIAVSGALIQAGDPTEETRRFIREIRRCRAGASVRPDSMVN